MITNKIKSIATTAGCDQVFYESKELSNIITDQSLQGNVFCLILQPNQVTLEQPANGIREKWPSYVIEVMQQVKLEDTAENNEVVYADLLEVCKRILWLLTNTGNFKKIPDPTLTKITENTYDSNPIGWSMPLELSLIENTNRC